MKIKVSFDVDTNESEPVSAYSTAIDEGCSLMTNEDIKVLTCINYDMQRAFKGIAEAVQHKSGMFVEGCKN
jgi:hypothetical protein